MKILFSAFVMIFVFSCAHQKPAAQPAPVVVKNNVSPRFPAADADVQDLAKMPDNQLLGYAGQNIMKYIFVCPAPTYIFLLAPTLETFPINLETPISLGTFGYSLVFSGSEQNTQTIFGYTKGSSASTKIMLNRFSKIAGDCGATGRRISDIYLEIQKRQPNFTKKN